MKRSFYEVLGVARDADQSQIDTAYASAGAKLAAVAVRGTAAATAEAKLLGDGYLLLSNPGRRAEYDAKLQADEAAEQLTITAMSGPARRKPRAGAVALVALTVVIGSFAYKHVSGKMEQVRIEHAAAVKRKIEEQTKIFVIDSTQDKPVVLTTSGGAPKPTSSRRD